MKQKSFFFVCVFFFCFTQILIMQVISFESKIPLDKWQKKTQRQATSFSTGWSYWSPWSANTYWQTNADCYSERSQFSSPPTTTVDPTRLQTEVGQQTVQLVWKLAVLHSSQWVSVACFPFQCDENLLLVNTSREGKSNQVASTQLYSCSVN